MHCIRENQALDSALLFCLLFDRLYQGKCTWVIGFWGYGIWGSGIWSRRVGEEGIGGEEVGGRG
jgi:hypothetical protein